MIVQLVDSINRRASSSGRGYVDNFASPSSIESKSSYFINSRVDARICVNYVLCLKGLGKEKILQHCGCTRRKDLK